MKTFIRLILVFVLFSACRRGIHSDVSYPATINIDTNAYPKLQKQFKIRELWKAPDYLGGLNPNYPIVMAHMDCRDSRDTDWMTGGFICTLPKIIIKKNDDYLLINNRTDLKNIYAPITSSQEALSYAILFTRFFAVFDESFFKSSYTYYGDKPSISFVMKEGENYNVHLFAYKQFGCGHPYYSVLVKVYKNGAVQVLSKTKAFEDPQEASLCVD